MRKYKKAAGLLAVSLVISMCSGCVMDREKSSESQAGETANLTDEDAEIKKAAKQDINEVHLRDKDTLYENDDETSVVTMYLTVSRGNVSENTDHSWKEINNYSVYDYDAMGVERYQAAALLQVGDEDGPQQGAVGYGETAPNATVQVRGQTSSEYAQKNYKIELKKNKGTWRGQRTINLNKHMGEGMRFRNKLAYDLMKKIPQMLSLRTQMLWEWNVIRLRLFCRSGMKMVHSRERSVMERLRQMPQCRSVDRHPANMHRRITKSS